jgi:hypothetical protein
MLGSVPVRCVSLARWDGSADRFGEGDRVGCRPVLVLHITSDALPVSLRGAAPRSARWIEFCIPIDGWMDGWIMDVTG